MEDVPDDIKAALEDCDYGVAALALIKVWRDSVIPNELAALLDNYMLRPGFETALPLLIFDGRFVIFFVESKPGGSFYRRFETGEWKA